MMVFIHYDGIVGRTMNFTKHVCWACWFKIKTWILVDKLLMLPIEHIMPYIMSLFHLMSTFFIAFSVMFTM